MLPTIDSENLGILDRVNTEIKGWLEIRKYV